MKERDKVGEEGRGVEARVSRQRGRDAFRYRDRRTNGAGKYFQTLQLVLSCSLDSVIICAQVSRNVLVN